MWSGRQETCSRLQPRAQGLDRRRAAGHDAGARPVDCRQGEPLPQLRQDLRLGGARRPAWRPRAVDCISRPRAATRRSASSRGKTPARQAATYSPTLWPSRAAGRTPHSIHRRARAYSTANRAGWATAVASSRRACSAGSPSTGKSTVRRSKPERRFQDLGAEVDLAAERRLGLVELAPHARVLRALAREQEGHRPVARLLVAGEDPLRIERTEERRRRRRGRGRPARGGAPAAAGRSAGSRRRRPAPGLGRLPDAPRGSASPSPAPPACAPKGPGAARDARGRRARPAAPPPAPRGRWCRRCRRSCTPARRGALPASQSASRELTKNGLAAKSISGFGSSKWRLGGIFPWRSISTVLIRPATPAAASRWPMLVLTEPMAQKPRRSVRARKARVRASISIGSPSEVPVPWAST